MSDNSPTKKKRKANDGRATVPDSSSHSTGGGGLFSSWLGYFSGRRDEITQTTTSDGENLSQKMDAMMQIMIRMEEKCSRLETKCSKLEHILETKMEQDESKFDSLAKHHEYNTMLVKNQSWKYSTPVHSFDHWTDDIGYNGDVAQYLAENSDYLKDSTEFLRRGEFPDYSDDSKGINLCWNEGDPILDHAARDIMRLHWIEFTDALKQSTPAFGVLSDGCETYFNLDNIQLPGNVAWRLKDALMHNPFQTLSFVNKADVGDNEGMKIVDIIDIMKSNKHLRKLTIGNNRIQLGHMEKFCSAVRHGSIVELDLKNCFENGVGNDMMTYLLINCGSKLRRLGLPCNEITSSSITLLADFLATNPMLKELDLGNNGLSGDCVDLVANALRSNTTLRLLRLYGNTIGDASNEALRHVLHNDSSLNSIADSNHSCSVEGFFQFHCWNVRGFRKNGAWHEAPASFNRAQKIYKLLSERNESMATSNVQHFDDTDVKLLPGILEAVHRYASVVHPSDRHRTGYCRVEPLSIVYEVMRKWDKVFPLYTD